MYMQRQKKILYSSNNVEKRYMGIKGSYMTNDFRADKKSLVFANLVVGGDDLRMRL